MLTRHLSRHPSCRLTAAISSPWSPAARLLIGGQIASPALRISAVPTFAAPSVTVRQQLGYVPGRFLHQQRAGLSDAEVASANPNGRKPVGSSDAITVRVLELLANANSGASVTRSGKKRHLFSTIRLMADKAVKGNPIGTAAATADRRLGEAVSDVLGQIEGEISLVWADGTCPARACHAAITEQQASVTSATIPPKDSAVAMGMAIPATRHSTTWMPRSVAAAGTIAAATRAPSSSPKTHDVPTQATLRRASLLSLRGTTDRRPTSGTPSSLPWPIWGDRNPLCGAVDSPIFQQCDRQESGQHAPAAPYFNPSMRYGERRYLTTMQVSGLTDFYRCLANLVAISRQVPCNKPCGRSKGPTYQTVYKSKPTGGMKLAKVTSQCLEPRKEHFMFNNPNVLNRNDLITRRGVYPVPGSSSRSAPLKCWPMASTRTKATMPP